MLPTEGPEERQQRRHDVDQTIGIGRHDDDGHLVEQDRQHSRHHTRTKGGEEILETKRARTNFGCSQQTVVVEKIVKLVGAKKSWRD
jgi:hypothetical protein